MTVAARMVLIHSFVSSLVRLLGKVGVHLQWELLPVMFDDDESPLMRSPFSLILFKSEKADVPEGFSYQV